MGSFSGSTGSQNCLFKQRDLTCHKKTTSEEVMTPTKKTYKYRSPDCYFKALCTNGKHLALATGNLILILNHVWSVLFSSLSSVSDNWYEIPTSHKISFFPGNPREGRLELCDLPLSYLINTS